MKLPAQRIKFKGQEFIIVGDKETGGAIASPEAYLACSVSFAHWFPDLDEVRQLGVKIGTGADIEWGELVFVESRIHYSPRE